jgi:hypothetical protein
MITFACPQCGKAGRLRDEFAGKRMTCRACQGSFTVPALPPPTEEVPIEQIPANVVQAWEPVINVQAAKPGPELWDDAPRKSMAPAVPEPRRLGVKPLTAIVAVILTPTVIIGSIALATFSDFRGAEELAIALAVAVLVVGPLFLAWMAGERRTIGGPMALVFVLLLSWLGLLIVCAFPLKGECQDDPMRTCPHCAERIKAAARVCR